MGVEVAIAVVSLATVAAGAYEQSRQAKSAAKDRKEAGRVAQAEQAAQMNQSRRAQVREERVRRAQVLQSAQNTGVSQSSGELGATSALGSLIGGNLAGMNRQQNTASAIGNLGQSAADAEIKGATWGAVSGVAGSIFGMSAGSLTKQSSPNVNPPVAGQNYSPTTAKSQSIFGN